MYRVTVTILALVFSLFQAAAALAEDWTVQKVKQPVNYTLDKQRWLRLEAGMTVPSGAWISTGPRGRVVLTHEQDMITVQPGSMTAVFAKDSAGKKFEIAQPMGEVVVDFEKRDGRNLTVQTPFLAAVVKGTRFTVKVDAQGAKLGVSRGVVGVSDPRRGQSVDVRPGQSATVAPGSALTVTGPGPKAPVVSVPVTTPVVPTVTQPTSPDPAGSGTTAAGAGNGNASGNGNGNQTTGNGTGNGNGNGTGNGGGTGSGNGNGNGNGNGSGSGNGGGHGHDGEDDGGDDSDHGDDHGNGNGHGHGNGHGNGVRNNR